MTQIDTQQKTKDLIINLDHRNFNLVETKAAEISSMFKPMLEKMVDLEEKYNEIICMEMSDDKIKMAGELLKEYVKVRTGTAKIHSELKSFYLNGGRFVDSWKNAQKIASETKEQALKELKDYKVNLEKARLENLRIERTKELEKYGFEIDNIPQSLGDMHDSVWEMFLKGVIDNYNKKIADEKKAEIERVEAERLEQIRIKKEKEEAEKNRIENERLKKEIADKEEAEKKRLKEIEKQKNENDRLKQEIAAKEEAEKKRIENERLINKEIESDEIDDFKFVNNSNDNEKRIYSEIDYKYKQLSIFEKILEQYYKDKDGLGVLLRLKINDLKKSLKM